MRRYEDALYRLGRIARSAGPYLLLEMLLPGGTLFALLLFLYRSGGLALGAGEALAARAPVAVVAQGRATVAPTRDRPHARGCPLLSCPQRRS